MLTLYIVNNRKEKKM